MTLKEFDKVRLAIQKERYSGAFSDPISFGINRAIFEQQRFQRLIAEAGKVANPTKSIQTRIAQWKRQHERAILIQARLEKTRELAERKRVMEPAMAA